MSKKGGTSHIERGGHLSYPTRTRTLPSQCTFPSQCRVRETDQQAGGHLQHFEHMVVSPVTPTELLRLSLPQLDRFREMLERFVTLRGGDNLGAPDLQKSKQLTYVRVTP